MHCFLIHQSFFAFFINPRIEFVLQYFTVLYRGDAFSSTINKPSPRPVHEHVIIKAILDGRPIAQTAAVEMLHGLSQDVGTGVPVHLQGTVVQSAGEQGRRQERGNKRADTHCLGVFIVETQHLQGAVVLQRPVQIPQLPVDPGDDGIVSQALTVRQHSVHYPAPHLLLRPVRLPPTVWQHRETPLH